MPYDDDGYQPVGRDAPAEWLRLEPRRMWHVFALGALAAAVSATISWSFGRSATRIIVQAAIFGGFFIVLGAYRLRKRQRH